MKLSKVARTLPARSRRVRRVARRVHRRAKKVGAALAPLERELDTVDSFLDWLDQQGLRSRPRIMALVFLLRSSERYDEFHEEALGFAAELDRLKRISSTFTPIQRGRYRPLLASLATYVQAVGALDEALGWVVRHPQDISRDLERRFSFSASTRVRNRRIRYTMNPAGLMMFGDAMESTIERIFELGRRGFSRLVRSFVDDALSSSLPEGALDRFPDPLFIDISSVTASESSLRSAKRTTLSINALEFMRVLEEEDHAGLLELIGATGDRVEQAAAREHPLLVRIRQEAIQALDAVWRKRALAQEYAGVLGIERLELPGHTGSFGSIDDFVDYADERIGRGVQPYFARNVGLHIAWVLVCDRFGTYRPIGTASIREIAGRKNAVQLIHKVMDEMKGDDAHGLVKRYAAACTRLTRAPLIKA